MDALLEVIIPMIQHHPRAIAYIGIAWTLLTACTNTWQSIPPARRDVWERKHPHLVGCIRIIAEVGIGLVKAARIGRHQAIGGSQRPSTVLKPVAVVTPTLEGESAR